MAFLARNVGGRLAVLKKRTNERAREALAFFPPHLVQRGEVGFAFNKKTNGAELSALGSHVEGGCVVLKATNAL